MSKHFLACRKCGAVGCDCRKQASTQHAEAGAVAWEVVGKYPHLPGPETFFYYGAAGKVHADAHAAQGDIVRPLGYLHPAQPASQQGEDSKEEVTIKLYWSSLYRCWRCESLCCHGAGATQRECIESWMSNKYPHPTGDKVRITDEMVSAYLNAVHEHLGNLSEKEWAAERADKDAALRRVARIGLTAALAQEKNDGTR